MNKSAFVKAIFSLALIVAAAAFPGCKDDKSGPEIGGSDPSTAYIHVAPEILTFDHNGTPVGSDGTFTIESNCEWGVSVEAGKEWVHLSATTGKKNGSITVTIPEPTTAGGRAEITFITTDALGTPATQKVRVIQNAATPEPPKGDVKITVDFALGAGITTPELPPFSKENFITGRHEYTIGGYQFAVFVDAEMSGKFYWIDNTQFFPAPEPNKGLFFSKEGAYIEFPAIAGKTLSAVSYTPTTSQTDVELDLLGSDGTEVQYALDFAADGSSQYALIDAVVNTHYRIVVIKKNAQCAKLVLTYVDAE